VAVGDVMNDLPYGPTVGAIRRIKLLVGETFDGGAEFVGECGDALDVTGAVSLRVGASPLEFSDGIREVQNRRSAHASKDEGEGAGVAGKKTIRKAYLTASYLFYFVSSWWSLLRVAALSFV
jgi:hypothetical protein